jgi:hypothetical protein
MYPDSPSLLPASQQQVLPWSAAASLGGLPLLLLGTVSILNLPSPKAYVCRPSFTHQHLQQHLAIARDTYQAPRQPHVISFFHQPSLVVQSLCSQQQHLFPDRHQLRFLQPLQISSPPPPPSADKPPFSTVTLLHFQRLKIPISASRPTSIPSQAHRDSHNTAYT